MKRIESACLEQTLIFDSREELEAYKRQLEKKRVPFKVESVQELPDSMVSVHMKRRYVHYPVGEYLD
ncbi:MAG: hypothetical protein ACI4MF_08010 [Candidatus Faecivicinus sp.]